MAETTTLQGATRSSAYPIYVLVTLAVVNAFNVGDRAIIAVVQEPIKAEFRLSDFQLGLLSGPAFALVYALCAIPVARLAERRSRAVIISVSLAAWSAMTVLCGMASSFVQLFVARMGVGIGESGSTPSAHSMIADYFSPQRRPIAISVFSVGQAAGAAILAVVGGLAAERLGWRGAFWVLGAPGILYAVVFILTVREPARAGPAQSPPAFGPALKLLWSKPTFRYAVIGGMLAQSASAVLLYGGSYLMRLHGLGLTDVALVNSVIPAVVGAAGMLGGGLVADRLVRRTPRALAIVPAVGMFLTGPLWALAFLAPSVPQFLAFFLPAALFGSSALPLIFAIGQNVSEPRTRATASAILLLATALIGQGLGAPAIGALSDALSNLFLQDAGIPLEACAAGAQAAGPCADASGRGLRWALAAFSNLFVLSGLVMLLAARTLPRDQVN